MACRVQEDSDCSEDQGDREKLRTPRTAGGYIMDIIHVGDVFNYTIPTFNVITVKVQHGVTSVWDEGQRKTVQYDIFLKTPQSDNYNWRVPCSIRVSESCYVPVSTLHEEARNLCIQRLI